MRVAVGFDAEPHIAPMKGNSAVTTNRRTSRLTKGAVVATGAGGKAKDSFALLFSCLGHCSSPYCKFVIRKSLSTRDEDRRRDQDGTGRKKCQVCGVRGRAPVSDSGNKVSNGARESVKLAIT